MATEKLTGKHLYSEMKSDAVLRRIQKMMDLRDQVDVENEHVRISYDNRKTTALVPSVSLIPVADCHNCAKCSNGCYDVRHCCLWGTVQKGRAINSAIAHEDMERYFHEIAERVKFMRFFRFHIGGDILSFWYFEHMVDIARRTQTCDFLVFTKMFGIVNHWIDKNGELPQNLHVIFSDWRGMKMDNPHGLPVSSPKWSDGTTGPNVTDRQFMCPGDCSQCATVGEGCWAAKKGDTILFEAH